MSKERGSPLVHALEFAFRPSHLQVKSQGQARLACMLVIAQYYAIVSVSVDKRTELYNSNSNEAANSMCCM